MSTEAVTRVRPAPLPRVVSDADIAAERRGAIRALLASPLLMAERAEPEDWLAVRRHAAWLREWFTDQLGWGLQLDARIGVARLRKQVGWANADASRGAIAPGGSHRSFSRRAYTLFCLACAELDRTAGSQALLTVLAEQIAIRSAAEHFGPFDRAVYAERFALVDALRLLEQLGALTLNDGDTDQFVAQTGDVLYTIDRDRLSRLVATNRVPSAAAGVADLVRESYPESRDGRTRRTRHSLMRRLIDDPVVYEADLDTDGRTYLRTQRAPITIWLRDAGLELERREEGAAAIDPARELSDVKFPGIGTNAHALLLVAEYLAERRREEPEADFVVGEEDLLAFVEVLIDQNRGRWAGHVVKAGASPLLDDVIEKLTAFRLARRVPGGLCPLPMIGRFRGPELNGLAAASDQLALEFGEAPDGR